MEPTIWPPRTINPRWPVRGEELPRPVTINDKATEENGVTRSLGIAMRRFCFIGRLKQMQIRDHHVDELHPEERRNYTADSIDQKVLTKQGRGPRAIANPRRASGMSAMMMIG